MDDSAKSTVIDAVIALAKSMNPNVHLGAKYGGMVFMTDSKTASSLIGGVYAYKDYVSVEFSNGATFDDPTRLLEGNGKARRHVKLHNSSDVTDKDVAGFLKQAFV